MRNSTNKEENSLRVNMKMEKMTITTNNKGKALDEFKQISDVLSVPTLGNPLPEHRRWKLPCPDKRALADHPEAAKDEDVKKCLQGT